MKSKSVWIIVSISVLITVAVVVVYANLKPASAKLQQLPIHSHDVRSAQFERDMGLLFGPSLVGGNRIEVLHNGKEIFPAMLAAIRGAEKSINMETFVYWQGDIADEFAHALSEKAREGLEVNLVLDAVGTGKMKEGLLDEMKEAGVRCRKFRPLNWYTIDRYNNRTHRKLLIVDGKIGFTGGVGIAEEWTGDAHDSDHFRDDHYRIEGPVVGQLQSAFMDNWQKAEGNVLHGDAYFPALQPVGDLRAHSVTSSPGAGGESAYTMYLLAIMAAQESLYIGSAYFVPDQLLVDALVEAADRGVRVEIMTPGPETDSDLARAASRGKWGPLLKAGVRIHEYMPTLYHNKTMVVDGYWSMVGSTNFDARSFRLNDENNLNVLDEAFAAEQIRIFNEDLKQAELYTYEKWENRPLKDKLLEPFALMVQSQL